jgi:hypothetical protein
MSVPHQPIGNVGLPAKEFANRVQVNVVAALLGNQRRLTRLDEIRSATRIHFDLKNRFHVNQTVSGGLHEGMGQAFKIAFRYATYNFQRRLTRRNGIPAATRIHFDLKNPFPAQGALRMGCTKEWGRPSKPHSAALHAIFKGD